MSATNDKNGNYEVLSDHVGGKVTVTVRPIKSTVPAADPYIEYKRGDDGTFHIEIDADRKRGEP